MRGTKVKRLRRQLDEILGARPMERYKRMAGSIQLVRTFPFRQLKKDRMAQERIATYVPTEHA